MNVTVIRAARSDRSKAQRLAADLRTLGLTAFVRCDGDDGADPTANAEGRGARHRTVILWSGGETDPAAPPDESLVVAAVSDPAARPQALTACATVDLRPWADAAAGRPALKALKGLVRTLKAPSNANRFVWPSGIGPWAGAVAAGLSGAVTVVLPVRLGWIGPDLADPRWLEALFTGGPLAWIPVSALLGAAVIVSSAVWSLVRHAGEAVPARTAAQPRAARENEEMAGEPLSLVRADA